MPKYRKALSDLEAPYIKVLVDLTRTQSKSTLANWAVDYAQKVMIPLWAKHFPEDRRPQDALEAARLWLSGEIKLPQAKPVILECHAAARDAEGNAAAQAAARAIGQSASTIHSARHCIGLPVYGALAVAYDIAGATADWVELERCAARECGRMLVALEVKMNYTIEPMQAEDWPRVAAIYQEGIDTGLATFQGSVPSWEDWDRGHIQRCRLVARIKDQVAGWAALSSVSSRPVYSGVGEVSVYVGNDYKQKGVGTALLEELIRRSEAEGFWMLQGVITRENTASIELHKKCGFRLVGIRERIARMPDGVWHDTALLERRSSIVGL